MKKGFMLIELLVVVLIIGILAAAALPQYRLAVQKTRTMRLMPLLRSISDAERIYFLENGSYTLSFSDLSIGMPAGGEFTHMPNGLDALNYGGFHCSLRRGSAHPATYSAYCNDNSPDAPSLEKYFVEKEFICWGSTDTSSVATRVCRSISGRTEANRASSNGTVGYSFQ